MLIVLQSYDNRIMSMYLFWTGLGQDKSRIKTNYVHIYYIPLHNCVLSLMSLLQSVSDVQLECIDELEALL